MDEMDIVGKGEDAPRIAELLDRRQVGHHMNLSLHKEAWPARLGFIDRNPRFKWMFIEKVMLHGTFQLLVSMLSEERSVALMRACSIEI